MSSLARSLLAFAALLTVAHGYCNTKTAGQTSPCYNPVYYQTIYFSAPGVNLDIPVNYCPFGMSVIGEVIKACNNNPYGPAPRIEGPFGQWSPVTVTCYNDGQQYPQCPEGGKIDITQCCA